MNTGKPVKIAAFTLLILLYGVLAWHQIDLPAADDLPRHLKNGEQILAGDFRVLKENVYSYTEPEQPFVNHHWLSGVVFYVIHALSGFEGLVIFKIIVLLSAFSLLFWVSLKKAGFWLVAALSVPTILILAERTSVRPEMFSFLFIAIFFYLLTEVRDDRTKLNFLWWLVPIQIVWVNLHIFFIIGPAMVAALLAEQAFLGGKGAVRDPLVRRLAGVFLLLLLASLLNPNGLRGAAFAYQLSVFDETVHISENRSLLEMHRENPFGNLSINVYYFAALLMLLSFFVGRKKRLIFYVMAGLASAAMGAAMLRGIAFFGLMFLPVASAHLSGALPKKASSANPLLLAGALVFFAGVPLLIYFSLSGSLFENKKPGLGLTSWSQASAEFLKSEKLAGPIFNDMDGGSYLVYHLYPEQKVFSDNRFADAYSKGFLERNNRLMSDEEEWEKVLAEYDFNLIYFYHYDFGPGFRQFLYRRLQDPAWVWIYADPYAVVLVRNRPENRDVIGRLAITDDNIKERLAPLEEADSYHEKVAAGDLYNLNRDWDKAIETYREIVMEWPDKAEVWTIMGIIEAGRGDDLSAMAAIDYLERAEAIGGRTAEIYAFLGLAHAILKDYERAGEFLSKAVSMNPAREDARGLLEELGKHGLIVGGD